MFYVLGKGWVAAGDLKVGDEVYLIDGSTAFITGTELEKLEEPIRVYNLEVADNNTYFVGDEAVLVHNYNQKDINKLQNGPEGTTVEVQSYSEANKLVEDAFPDYQKVAGIGIEKEGHIPTGTRKHNKIVAYEKGGTYHKDYMGGIDKVGKVVVAGHTGAKNPHRNYPHINIKRRDGVEVLINIVGEILGH